MVHGEWRAHAGQEKGNLFYSPFFLKDKAAWLSKKKKKKKKERDLQSDDVTALRQVGNGKGRHVSV
jgi:hypothetical protein